MYVIIFLGNAVGEQHEKTKALYRLPQRAQRRNDHRCCYVFYRRTFRLS